jgi:hypothetical protein
MLGVQGFVQNLLLRLAGSILARAKASRITIDPNSVADTLANEPPNLPTAVRAAETITMSSMDSPCIKKLILKISC